jgi:hypothetical protein
MAASSSTASLMSWASFQCSCLLQDTGNEQE